MELEEIAELERTWGLRFRELRESPYNYGWEPYPIKRYLKLLDLAIQRSPGKRFLEVGCGIGTKCLIAQQHGLEVFGIEKYVEYAEEARRLGIKVEVVDATVWTRYDEFDIVFVNHPLKLMTDEVNLECQIQDGMASGAVLMTANNANARPYHWGAIVTPMWSDIPRFKLDSVAVKP